MTSLLCIQFHTKWNSKLFVTAPSKQDCSSIFCKQNSLTNPNLNYHTATHKHAASVCSITHLHPPLPITHTYEYIKFVQTYFLCLYIPLQQQHYWCNRRVCRSEYLEFNRRWRRFRPPCFCEHKILHVCSSSLHEQSSQRCDTRQCVGNRLGSSTNDVLDGRMGHHHKSKIASKRTSLSLAHSKNQNVYSFFRKSPYLRSGIDTRSENA